MGTVLGTLAELGYGTAYRILDAQWFGVPQRRRRVFIVGCLGDWRRAAEVLFEPESLPWDSPPSREAGKGVAGSVTQRIDRSGVNSEGHDRHLVSHALCSEGFDASEDGTGRGTPIIPFDTTQVTSEANRSNPQPGDPCHPLAKGAHPPAVAFQPKASVSQSMNPSETCPTIGTSKEPAVAYSFQDQRGRQNEGEPLVEQVATLHAAKGPSEQQAVAYQQHGSDVGKAGALRAGHGDVQSGVPFVATASTIKAGMARCWNDNEGIDNLTGAQMAVRRLTPCECERLQGFPDDFTRYDAEGTEIKDGPRYRMLGNAVAVPVAEWIGRRIVEAAT